MQDFETWQVAIIRTLRVLMDENLQERAWMAETGFFLPSPTELACELFDDTTLQNRLDEQITVFTPDVDPMLGDLSRRMDAIDLERSPAVLLADSKWVEIRVISGEILDALGE